MKTMEVIKVRRSVRTYEKKPIAGEQWHEISGELDLLSREYRIKLSLLENVFSDKKFGTYGVIKDPAAFIAVCCRNEKEALLQAGLAVEKAVLLCTSLRIGTCWLGGTFHREDFKTALAPSADEIIPAVIAMGYPRATERILNNIMRAGAKSDSRKPFSEMFFDGDWQHPFPQDESAEGKALEAVRLGPSASNKQPWRVIRQGERFHFYLAHTPRYATAYSFDMQLLDIGIAMAHFELALLEMGESGGWKTEEPNLSDLAEQMEYMVSWERFAAIES